MIFVLVQRIPFEAIIEWRSASTPDGMLAVAKKTSAINAVMTGPTEGISRPRE
jgi:hypothetical protein